MGAISAQEEVVEPCFGSGVPVSVEGIQGIRSDGGLRTIRDLLNKPVGYKDLTRRVDRRSPPHQLQVKLDSDGYRKLLSLRGNVRLHAIAVDSEPPPDCTQHDDPVLALAAFHKERAAPLLPVLESLKVTYDLEEVLGVIPLTVSPSQLGRLMAELSRHGWQLHLSINEPLRIGSFHSAAEGDAPAEMGVGGSTGAALPCPASLSGPPATSTCLVKNHDRCGKSGEIWIGVVDSGVQPSKLPPGTGVDYYEFDSKGRLVSLVARDLDESHGSIVSSIIVDTVSHLVPSLKPRLIVGSAFYYRGKSHAPGCSDSSLTSAFAKVLWRRPVVINCSFVTINGKGKATYSEILKNLCANAKAIGVFVVAATGNDGPGFVGAPAAYDTALSVGAVTSTGHLWPGTGHDVRHPAKNPEILARGELKRVSPEICTSWATANTSAHVAAAVAQKLPPWDSLHQNAEVVHFPPSRPVLRLRHVLR